MRVATTEIPVTSERSYRQVVDYLLRFAIGRIVEGEHTDYPRTMCPGIGFVGRMLGNVEAQVGDLIRLEAAGQSKWTLSWLLEIRRTKHGDYEFLCESLIDRDQCWWSNVGVSYLHRRTVAQHPEWRWTDAQHAFNDKWLKACRRFDTHLYRPFAADFNADGSVTLGTNSRYDFDKLRPTVTLQRWQKLTLKALAEVYQQCLAQHEALASQPREAAQ